MRKVIFFLLLAMAAQSQAQTGKDEALTALGGSGGMLLYNTYLVIGATADGYGGEVYDAATADAIIQEQIDGIVTIQQQYHDLLASKFLTDPSDVTYVKRMMATFDLISDEAKALKRYLSSDSDADAQDYEAKRVKAWEKIADLLGIEK